MGQRGPIERPALRILSLGAGVQSSALILLARDGELERPDCAIFADTGWEPAAVYRHLDWLEREIGGAIPIHRVSAGNIRDDILRGLGGTRTAQIPFFVRNHEGDLAMLRRGCTSEYKVDPIVRKIRELLGVARGEQVKRTWGDGVVVEQWFGISLDEVTRMRDSRLPWARNHYPLVEKRMRRSDCLAWMQKRGYPRPPKSSCIGCPYHDNALWRKMRDDQPGEWLDAVEFDGLIRRGLRGIDCEAFLHSQLVPLDQADLGGNDNQLGFGFLDDCEGLCGV